MTLVVATRNAGKLAEIAGALRREASTITLRSLSDYPDVAELPETAETFEGNAILKATTLAVQVGLPALADDSGLAVDALGGFPGVHSARFAGPDATDADRNAALVARLRASGVPPAQWTARFVCVLAVASPEGLCATYRGECLGRIIEEPRGVNGFGYDPVFLRPDDGRTLAEHTRDEKNACSHRGAALAKLLADLPRLMERLGGPTPLGGATRGTGEVP